MRFLEKVPVRVYSMVQNSFEFFFIEIKPLFSVILTHLGANGSTFPHSHPFHAITFLLKGYLKEYNEEGLCVGVYKAPGMKFTNRDIHQISTGKNGAWFLTLRGPWISDTWVEVRGDKTIQLTHGRKEIN